jgi:regulator of nucleoside diphosphate kinase
MASTASASPASTRPLIRLVDHEAERLADLAVRAADLVPDVAELLLGEIDRAEIHSPGSLPDDVVTMYSQVDYRDEASGRTRSVQLVYPADADISLGRVSILTPVAAGLIGLSVGQSIGWPDRDGRERRLVVVRVQQPPTQ